MPANIRIPVLLAKVDGLIFICIIGRLVAVKKLLEAPAVPPVGYSAQTALWLAVLTAVAVILSIPLAPPGWLGVQVSVVTDCTLALNVMSPWPESWLAAGRQAAVPPLMWPP